MSATEILPPFGPPSHYNLWQRSVFYTQARGEDDATKAARRERFTQDVELAVLGKVNEYEFLDGHRRYKPHLPPSAFKSKSQRRPYSKARQWLFYILYNHPETGNVYSSVTLARRYRFDHSTILYQISQAKNDLRRKDEFGKGLMEVCAYLTRIGYADFNPRGEG